MQDLRHERRESPVIIFGSLLERSFRLWRKPDACRNQSGGGLLCWLFRCPCHETSLICKRTWRILTGASLSQTGRKLNGGKYMALKTGLAKFPGIQKIAPETIEKHDLEQQLRAAQYALDLMLHDLRSEFLAREAKLREDYLSKVAAITVRE
jgi:hypothetical protein